MTIKEYEQRFRTILNLNNPSIDRDKMLSALMSEMEHTFQIPMIKNEDWEKENHEVYSLYRKVSESRSF